MSSAGRYTILRKIADGGMAEIFLGSQRGAAGFERPVIVKRIRTAFYADPHFRNMLIDEAHIAMSLNHSNIVQVLDLGTWGGRYFLILELVDGWDLNHVMHRSTLTNVALPPELALYITAEVCRALAYAHNKRRDGKALGIVHRDVSPHNILISDQGEVKLTDFGIATAYGKREKTTPGMVKGKVGFMSPEQASGQVLDARSDLFSVGTTLYLMVTGQRPFAAASDLESLLRTERADFPAPQQARPDLHPELAAVILKAMKRSRDERYATTDEMLLDVERVLRTAYKPVGQTELKLWLAKLSEKDGVLPIAKAPPPAEVEDSDVELIEGGDVVLSDVDSQGRPASGSSPAVSPSKEMAAAAAKVEGAAAAGVGRDELVVPLLLDKPLEPIALAAPLPTPQSTPSSTPSKSMSATPSTSPAQSAPSAPSTSSPASAASAANAASAADTSNASPPKEHRPPSKILAPAPLSGLSAPTVSSTSITQPDTPSKEFPGLALQRTPKRPRSRLWMVVLGLLGIAGTLLAVKQPWAPTNADESTTGSVAMLDPVEVDGGVESASADGGEAVEEASLALPVAESPVDAGDTEVVIADPPVVKPPEVVDAGKPVETHVTETRPPVTRPVVNRQPPPHPAAEPSAEVAIQINSTPAGAFVRVNKKLYGASPIRIRVKPGLSYDLDFDKQGYEPSQKRIYVAPKNNQTFQVAMKKKSWWSW
jgi:serine/threonine-protein kinase